MSGEQQNEYEAERARRIAENKAKMAQLGLMDASAAISGASHQFSNLPSSAGRQARPKARRSNKKEKAAAPAAPTRESKRLRGYTADPEAAAAEAARLEAQQQAAASAQDTTASKTKKSLSIPENTDIAAPFTVLSIATTVWDLGQVHRGAWAQRYWSNRGCLFHHAYPVGYRAEKTVFDRDYEMRIEAGPTGPIFKVIDMTSGRVFSGASPTKPWTEVCIAHRTGQRISGPLFFGFSDPLTQAAIALNCYNEKELAAALAGERVEAEELSSEEIAAKEFMELEGIGEGTAMVLARTTALGGKQHPGIASLKAWVQESRENAAAMLVFLLNSDEMPETMKRWPAWKERIAPKVVAGLAGVAAVESQDKAEETRKKEECDRAVGGEMEIEEQGGKENVEEAMEGAGEPSPSKIAAAVVTAAVEAVIAQNAVACEVAVPRQMLGDVVSN